MKFLQLPSLVFCQMCGHPVAYRYGTDAKSLFCEPRGHVVAAFVELPCERRRREHQEVHAKRRWLKSLKTIFGQWKTMRERGIRLTPDPKRLPE